MKQAAKTNYLAGAGAVAGAVAAIAAYAFLAPAVDASDRRRQRLTLAGKLQVLLLRAVPNKAFMTLWNRGRHMPDKPVQATVDQQLPTRHGPVTCRIYRPFNAAGAALPLYVNMHGGGFVFRGLDQEMPFAATLPARRRAWW